MVHNYRVFYRDIKYPRIELKKGFLELILPFGTDTRKILKRHHKWIMKKKSQIDEYLKNNGNIKIINRSEDKFRILTEEIVKKYSEELGVEYNKIFYRKMRTKWASCSPNKNITINSIMKYLPKRLIEYILYHEFIHLFEKRHNTRFWNLISRRFKSYEKFEAELFSYWFTLANRFNL